MSILRSKRITIFLLLLTILVLFSFFTLILYKDFPHQSFTLSEEGAEYRIRKEGEGDRYVIVMKNNDNEPWWSVQILSSMVNLDNYFDKPVRIFGDFSSRYEKPYCGHQSICDEIYKGKFAGYHITNIELVQ